MPGDGAADPSGVTHMLAKGARMHGAQIFEKTTVKKILIKNKKIVGIVDQEGNPFTDGDLIRMLRKYISGNKIKTKQLTWRAQQHEKIKKKFIK